MAMRNAVLYLVSVGGCVLAIVGLLYLGEDLVAPMSVGGAWTIRAASGCDAVSAPAFKISQSGPRLEIQLEGKPATLLHGELAGSTVTAESRPDDPARVRLTGGAGKAGGEARLQGTLEVAGCGTPIAIVATREPAAARSDTGH